MTRDQNKPQTGATGTPKFLMRGFTVTELLVVCSIMMVLASLVLVNWNKQQPQRSLKISQNELITNIRKVQGYAVSSRNINTNTAVRFYALKFVEGASGYTVHAVQSDLTMYPQPIETQSLASGITLSKTELIPVNIADPACVAVIFSVVYGKTYFLDGTTCSDAAIISAVSDPTALPDLADHDLVLTLENTPNAISNQIKIDAQTGRVEPYVKKSGR